MRNKRKKLDKEQDTTDFSSIKFSDVDGVFRGKIKIIDSFPVRRNKKTDRKEK